RETVTFHCQLSAGLKFGSIELIVPTPTAAACNAGLMVSSLRQVGQSANETAPGFQPESTAVFQGGLAASRSKPEITFARLMYRPPPRRRAVLPFPLMSHA